MNDFCEKKIKRNPKGTMLVAVLIIMLLVSSVAIAIIGRTKQGAALTISAKKGYSTYKDADQSAEDFLSRLKSYDDMTGKIPENSAASEICGGDVKCADGSGSSQSVTRISEIFRFIRKKDDNDTETSRAISASVPGRIESGISSISVEQEGANKCDFKVSWTGGPDSSDAEYLELRRAIGGNLADTNSEWTMVDNDINISSNSFSMGNSNHNYGRTYYYAIKAKNKNPLSLDSLYVNRTASSSYKNYAEIENNPECSGIGCTSSNIPGTTNMGGNRTYNCCNGTRCLIPDTNWTESGDGACALQNCLPENNVGTNPTGTATTGWCGTAKPCVAGTGCNHPYKTLGYCLTKPGDSSQSSFLSSSSWTLSGNADTYEDPDSSENQDRCAKHNCPSDVIQNCGEPLSGHGSFSASLISCSSPSCGPYTASVRCNLSCDSGFHPAETKASLTTNQVTVSYSDNCCYQDCPAPPVCACGSNWSCTPNCGGSVITGGCLACPIP